MTNVASGDQEIINGRICNNIKKINAKFIAFYETFRGLGLLISKAQVGTYVAIENDGSGSIKPDLKFPSSKSKCTDLNKWHVISITWSDKREDLSNCWSNGEKLTTFTMRNIKGSDYCYIGDLGKISGWSKTHLTGCTGEIIGFYRALNDPQSLYIHKYLMLYAILFPRPIILQKSYEILCKMFPKVRSNFVQCVAQSHTLPKIQHQ